MTHYAGHRAPPPAGYSTWEEFYRERAANPQMFGDGTSIGPSYPDRFTEEFVNSPFIRLLAPWAKTALMSKGTPLQQNPSPVDYALSAVDVALPAVPVGLIAGRVKDVAKEPIKNIGQWLIKVRTKGADYLSHKRAKEEAKKLYFEGSPIGQGVHYESLKAADDVIKSGDAQRIKDFIILPKGHQGAEHLPMSSSHFTPLGYRRNTPKQREYLKTIKTRSNRKGFDVDNMSDDKVAKLVRGRHGWLKNRDPSLKHMATLEEDVGEALGGKGLNITTNVDLQKAVAQMDVSSIERYVGQTVYDYLKRRGLKQGDIPTAQLNQLKDIVRNNLLLRRGRLQTAKPLWQLNKQGVYEPQLVIQTHHGKPTAEFIGGSVTDPRNIWAVSGSAGQGGTHGLVHTPKSEVNPFYQSLRANYYSPYFEEAVKSGKRGLEPYPGFLDELQGLDPKLWDYNMQEAYARFRKKNPRNIWD